MISEHRHIPVEILIEIIKRIDDFKSLIRWRSVSKEWKSLIDSKEFIAAHTTFLISHPETQHHRLLVSYAGLDHPGYKFESFVDDDSFRHDQKVTLFRPNSVNYDTPLVSSSHGLFCFDDYKKAAVIWNPSIRKSVAVNLPNMLSNPYMTCVGFGVCPRTIDPKLVKINCIIYGSEYRDSGIPHQVEVFTLSSGSWRSPLSSNLPGKSISFGWSQVIIDGFIYWDASVTIIVDGKSKLCNLVMSFDLTNEEFKEHDLPDCLAEYDLNGELMVSKLRDSLAVIEVSPYSDIHYCAVWMMTDHGYSRSFKIAKQFTIVLPDTQVYKAIGFTKSGVPIIEKDFDNDIESCKLSVYEPCSQHMNDISLYGLRDSFFMNSYIETLLLLDQ